MKGKDWPSAHERHEHHVHMVAKQAGQSISYLCNLDGIFHGELRPAQTCIHSNHLIRFHGAESTRNRLLTLSLQAALFSRAAHHFQALCLQRAKKKQNYQNSQNIQPAHPGFNMFNGFLQIFP